MTRKNDKLIISIYDYTGAWAEPYIKAGYPVMLWDKKKEGDILEGFSSLLMEIEETGLQVYGLLFAPPCTDFASSGARWWKDKDKKTADLIPFDTQTELSMSLVLICLHLVSIVKPHFWVLENPVGRIETIVPELKPFRKMTFNPSDFGDPYTKKTILWGNFNSNLQKKYVLALMGSLMHKTPPSKKRQEIRSATPKGFARAFFEANK